MKYRMFGSTGEKVSVLAYGGSSLGSEFRPIDEAEGIRSVHVALDQGINLIDTAPYYGATRAETVLGRALKGIARDRYLLATKVGRYGPVMENFDFTAQRVIRSVDESLGRLGVDYVDFIQVHDMEFGDLGLICEETIPALRKIQQQGKARFIGITGYPLRPFRHVLGRVDVDLVQSYCHYCLNDTSFAALLPLLKEKGVGIVNSAPLAMRLLTNEGPPAWHPAPAMVRARCAEVAGYCRSRGGDLGRLALQFAVAHPDIHTTIVGTADPERVRENIAAVESPIDEDLLTEVQARLAPIHQQGWISGRPENN